MSMSTILPNSISFKDHEFYLLIKQPLFFSFSVTVSWEVKGVEFIRI